jgi:arginine decarboxylase
MAEWLYGRIIKKINGIVEKLKPIPEELQNFKQIMRQTYFANFSLFQSIPDSWAIDQLFPIMPIQRLTEKPDIIASIADITCDSDGEITSFVGENGRTKALPLHKIRKDEDYYIGFFLIGAYQEILGDLHNLFGDTNAVHITFNKKTNYKIDTVSPRRHLQSSICPVRRQRDSQSVRTTGKQRSCPPHHHRGEQPLLELLEKSLQSYTYLGNKLRLL